VQYVLECRHVAVTDNSFQRAEETDKQHNDVILAGMSRPRGQPGLEAKIFGFGLGLGLEHLASASFSASYNAGLVLTKVGLVPRLVASLSVTENTSLTLR